MADARIVIAATDNASRVLSGVRASLDTVQTSAAKLGPVFSRLGFGAAAGAASLAGVAAFVRGIVNGIDALNDLKDATGASIENISALEDVAARTGTSFDAVGSSLVKFNAALKDAKPGSDAAAAFDAIGLSVKDLKALDPAEALRKTAVALAGFADDGNKARLVQELFGKSLREVAPFLADLAKQGQLVATVTTQQAEEAEKFNQQLAAMKKNVLDVERALVGPLVSALNETADAFRRSAKEGKGFFEIILDRYLENVRAFKANGGTIGPFSFGEPRAPKFLLDYSKDNQSAAETARLGRRRSVDFDGASKPVRAGRGGGSTKTTAEQLTDDQRALASYVDGLSRALEKTQELTETEKALNFLRFSNAGQVPQVRELVLGLAQQVDQTKRLREEKEALLVVDEALTEQEKQAASAYEERLQSLLSGTESEVFKRQQSDLEFLQQALDKGTIKLEQYSEAVRELFGITEPRLDKTKSLAEDLGLSFTSAFEDAIVGGKKFSDVLKGLEQDILRIVTRKLVTEPLGNAITGIFKGGGGGGDLFGGIGKFFSGLFGFEGGGFTGTGARIGGLDGRGGMLAMVHPNESVIDHTRGQRGGNVVSITVNQQFAAGTSRATTAQAAADARRQLEMGARNL
jgi:hypothetical protein